MADVNMTLGAKEAGQGAITATLIVDVKVTRWFIWRLKLRCIWTIIRANPKHG